MKRETIKVLYKQVGKASGVREIPNTLVACQELVGGDIETVTICTDLLLVCNGEGRIRGLGSNPFLGYDFHGDWFLCGVDGEEFADVPGLDDKEVIVQDTLRDEAADTRNREHLLGKERSAYD